MPDSKETLLEVNNIEVIYNHVILVLKGVSLNVPKGGITALLGGNGAGKTTTLKAISNLLHSERGEVTKGSVIYRGEPVHHLSPEALVKKGVVQVMEGRHCFEHLTVEENLKLAQIAPRSAGRSSVSTNCSRDSASGKTRTARRSRAASSNGWLWPVPWCISHDWCWPMNRPATWTPRLPHKRSIYFATPAASKAQP